MRILICTSEHGTTAGGLALHCVQLKYLFQKLGHQVFLEVILNPQDYYAIDGGYDSSLADRIRTSNMIRTLSEKYGENVDLCVSCGAGKTAYLSSIYCKMNNIKLDIVLCGSEVNIAFGRSDLCFYNSEAFKYASNVISLSKELNKFAKAIYYNKECNYYVVPNVYAIPELIKFDNKIIKEKVIYATGATYISEKKGIANLITAFSYLINGYKRDDILYLYGKVDDDICKCYKALISKYNLEKNVFLCGYLCREEFNEKMDEIDVFIQASPFEGFGNSVAEAIQKGKNILISNTGFFAELLRDNYSEYVFDSLDPKDMAAFLNDYPKKALKNSRLPEITNICREALSENTVLYTWDKILTNNHKNNNYTRTVSVMFHDVDNAYTGIDFALTGFESLMNKIYLKGLKLCSLKDYLRSENRNNLIICTFDDGYENVYKNAFPVMKKYGFTATVFVCPDFIGKDNRWNRKDETNRKHLSDEMIKLLVKEGWEIGSHGMSHINLQRLSESELIKCLYDSKKSLEKYGDIIAFCYPYGAFKPFIRDKVKCYYEYAFSIDVGGTDIEQNRFQITRFTPEQLKKWIG